MTAVRKIVDVEVSLVILMCQALLAQKALQAYRDLLEIPYT